MSYSNLGDVLYSNDLVKISLGGDSLRFADPVEALRGIELRRVLT